MRQTSITSSELPVNTAARSTKDVGRLINIGDQVFGLVVTDLIRDSYPNLSVGPSSVRSVRPAFLPFKSNHLIAILQKVRDRLKYHGKLAKTYYASWAELFSVC